MTRSWTLSSSTMLCHARFTDLNTSYTRELRITSQDVSRSADSVDHSFLAEAAPRAAPPARRRRSLLCYQIVIY